MFRISIIGVGKLGKPTADLMIELGHDVRTYDSAFVTGYTFEEAVRDRDLIFIAVPTPHEKEYDGSGVISHLEPKDFNYNALQQVVADCHKYQPNTPIVIISTVLPGTIRRLFSQYSDKLVYNPYLIGMGSVKEDLKDPDILIIGTASGKKNDTTDKLLSIYQQMYNCVFPHGMVNIGTWEEAESIKIFYNTFISTKLALVNMIQDVAMKTGNMNVDVVTRALQNSTKRITGPKYMTAGMGDGGPCHPRDNIALRWLAKELDLGYDIFSTIVETRELQAKNLARFLVIEAAKNNLPIYIHGKSFKPDVPYTDGSYSLLVGQYVKEISGEDPIYIDPLTENEPSMNIKGVVLLAHNASVTYNYSSNKTTNDMYCEFDSGSIIVDPWRTYKNNDQSIKVIYYGNTRGSSSQ
jgi:UDPglucose 6-dehydrogenase